MGNYNENFLDSYWVWIPDTSENTLKQLQTTRLPLTYRLSTKIDVYRPRQIATWEPGWNHVMVYWEGTYVESLNDVKAYLEGLLGSLPEKEHQDNQSIDIMKHNTTDLSLTH